MVNKYNERPIARYRCGDFVLNISWDDSKRDYGAHLSGPGISEGLNENCHGDIEGGIAEGRAMAVQRTGTRAEDWKLEYRGLPFRDPHKGALDDS